MKEMKASKKGQREVQALLAVLSGYDNRHVDLKNIDKDRLTQLALRHRLSHDMLQYARRHPDLLLPGHVRILEERCRQNAVTSLFQLQELVKFSEELRSHHLSFAVIKGQQLSRMLYGREASKESVDLDLMLPDATDLPEVIKLLEALGYTRSNISSYRQGWRRKFFLLAKREVACINPVTRCAVDLHIRPGANTYLTAGRFEGFFNDLQDFELEGTVLPVPPDEKYLVYLCYHGSLHQFSRLAWLIDIRAFVQTRKENLDYAKVLATACRLRAERSLSLALLLLEEYFGDPVPPDLVTQTRRTLRMRLLASICRSQLYRYPQYGLSLHGRFVKFMYIMVLLKGMAARADWIFGIAMRMLVKMIR
jgi:hypothetical protein